MKYNQKHTTRLYRKQNFDTPDINKIGFVDMIYPFEVKTGFVNTTEKGLTYTNEITSSRFERIFTGFEAISIVWKGSTNTIVRTKPDPTDILKTVKSLYKEYKPGEAIPVLFDNERMEADFENVSFSQQYTKEKVVTTVELYSNTLFTKLDEYNLYTMPARFEDEIFYIKDIEEYFDKDNPEVLKYSKLTLQSLNDKLANTGLAIDQYVQLSAPGEGYAWPLQVKGIDDYERRDFASGTYDSTTDILAADLIDGTTFLINHFNHYGETIVQYFKGEYSVIANVNRYVLDASKLANKPIVSAQLELYGPGILSSVYAFGRPISALENSNDEQIEKPRLLLPYKMNGPDLTQRAFDKPLSQTTQSYWIPRSRMEIESFYKDWTEKSQGDWNPGITKKWLGYLRILTRDYKSAQPHLAWRIFTDIATLGLAEIAYNRPDVEHPANGYQVLKGVQTLPKLLSNGYFTHRNAPRLPMTYKESIPWTLKNIPLVGAWLNKMTFGLPIGWKNQTEMGGRNYNVTGIIPGSLLDFYKNTFIGVKTETLKAITQGSNKQDYTAIPFDGLSDGAQQSALSPGELSTIINFDLTDRFYGNSHDPNVYGNEGDTTKAPIPPTQDLKHTDVNGVDFPIHDTVDLGTVGAAKYRVSSMPAVKEPTTHGYAIDAFGFHFLGQADWKISLYDEDGNVQFSGTYKTLSKLTDSIRDWNTNLKLSHWESDESVDSSEYEKQPDPSLPTNTAPSLNGVANGILYPITKLDLTINGSVATSVELNALTGMEYGDRWEVRASLKIFEWGGTAWVDKGSVSDNLKTALDSSGKPIFEYDDRGVLKVNTIASLDDRNAEREHEYDAIKEVKEYEINTPRVAFTTFDIKHDELVYDDIFLSQNILTQLYTDGFRTITADYRMEMFKFINHQELSTQLKDIATFNIEPDGTITFNSLKSGKSHTFSFAFQWEIEWTNTKIVLSNDKNPGLGSKLLFEFSNGIAHKP